MLIIGPGGGKEVLIGLFGEVEKIIGVEVNPDFVEIVKNHKEFDGGIYSDFPNVEIVVEEGRHYVKQSKDTFDLIVMALPSTEQMQNIEPFAMSENYLLTTEAIQEYLKILTPEGRLILTVHNRWELMRVMTTAVSVLNDMGIAGDEMQNHFVVFEAEYAPTVIIKKSAFTMDETLRWQKTCRTLPQDFPNVTYLPFGVMGSNRSTIDNFLTRVCRSDKSLQAYIAHHEYDISPCRDDKPYFYKIYRGIPQEYLWLLVGIAGFSFLVIWLPLMLVRKRERQNNLQEITLPLTIFSCIGIGFMVIEISLFQKLVLYLGSPTISLSILLSSLLVGMGIGSYFGKRIYEAELRRRLSVVSISIVVTGILFVVASPYLLSKCLEYGLALRSAVCFLMILPLAFLLGIPFPSCIQLMKLEKKEVHIPWMYGVNGSMSVMGSVLAIVLSMILGFTMTYFVGLSFYLSIFAALLLTEGRRARAAV
jgi:SAM-dependent methyltransferase